MSADLSGVGIAEGIPETNQATATLNTTYL